MKAGDYDLVDDADCQPCERRRKDTAFISSAYFAQDAGTRLLEMSLAQAKAGRAERGAPPAKAAGKPAKRPAAAKPDLKVLPDPPARAADTATSGPRAKTAAKSRDADAPTARELAALGMDDLRPDGDGVYRSAGGVRVRVERRGGDWRIAEVVMPGRVQVRKPARGVVAVEVGDVTVRLDGEGNLSLG
jgi:hypothetical protein